MTSKIADVNGALGPTGLSCQSQAHRSPRMCAPVAARAAGWRLGFGSNDSSPGPVTTATRVSFGNNARPALLARAAGWFSSSAMLRFQAAGARPRPTWSCKNTSAASWAHPDASTPCASSSTAWPTPSLDGGCRTGTLRTRFRPTTTAPSSSTCWSSRRCLSIRPSGST